MKSTNLFTDVVAVQPPNIGDLNGICRHCKDIPHPHLWEPENVCRYSWSKGECPMPLKSIAFVDTRGEGCWIFALKGINAQIKTKCITHHKESISCWNEYVSKRHPCGIRNPLECIYLIVSSSDLKKECGINLANFLKDDLPDSDKVTWIESPHNLRDIIVTAIKKVRQNNAYHPNSFVLAVNCFADKDLVAEIYNSVGRISEYFGHPIPNNLLSEDE